MDVGRPVPGLRGAVTDDAGEPLGDRRVGHIEVRGPQVARGYHRAPEATRRHVRRRLAAHRRPGLPARGRLCVTGRDKDVVFVDGRTFHAPDLEEVAAATPGLPGATVAVVGLHRSGRRRASGSSSSCVAARPPWRTARPCSRGGGPGPARRWATTTYGCCRCRRGRSPGRPAASCGARCCASGSRPGRMRTVEGCGGVGGRAAVALRQRARPPAHEARRPAPARPGRGWRSCGRRALAAGRVAGRSVRRDVRWCHGRLGPGARAPVRRSARNDRFLALGGSSLKAMEVLAALEDAFSVRWTVRLRDHDTVAALAGHDAGLPTAAVPPVPDGPGGSGGSERPCIRSGAVRDSPGGVIGIPAACPRSDEARSRVRGRTRPWRRDR